MAGQAPNMDQFEVYFQRADVDRDGRISGNEAVAFLQASNLPRKVLAQIWTSADQNQVGFLGRSEFYNALKLVTVAQSGRELTPSLVEAALKGPASAKIPPPQINVAAMQGPQSNSNAGPSPAQLAGPPNSNQGVAVSGLHGFPAQPSQVVRPSRPPTPSPGFQSQPGVSTGGMPGIGSLSQSQPSAITQGMPGVGPTSVAQRPNSVDLLGGTMDGSRAGVSSQVSSRSLSPSATKGDFGLPASPITQTKAPEVSGSLQSASSKPNDTASLNSQVGKEDSISATGNGFAADSLFGDTFSAKPSQPQQNSSALAYPSGNTPTSSTGILSSSTNQPLLKPSAVSQPPAVQAPQLQSFGRANQPGLAQRPPAYPVAAGQSQPPWPRMTQLDVQKYRKVFVQVDKDQDGKITGEQAHSLFLSWKLPREILKQVWDLSDQDNDSMLSLREFCIALYLMERYREGRPLPSTLPNSVMFEETLVPASGQPAAAAAYGNTSWRPPTPGFQQAQGTRNPRSIPSASGGRPPRPAPIPQPDEPVQQKAKVPVLEKHLLDQLSTEEQDSLNKKFEEAKDAEKKVADLEKEIVEAKQKIQFFHAKMQELILYKSRCDNRLNEISERVVGDKREAESLAKKYEEKYKQTGDVASKLTIEESTFRDIQEKKMELYRAIIALEQTNGDGIQEQADQIQADLDELVKSLNERCKTYGLRGKPTSLVELPFGWQTGIEASAADWDEVWDKFEDEGFTYVKELTLEVENVVAPPKPKTALIREKITSSDNSNTVKSPSKADGKSELLRESDSPKTDNREQAARTPPDSPLGSNAVMSPSKGFNVNGSPHAFDTQSEFGAESVRGDKGFDEPGWGTFDTHYDSDAAWDFNKEAEHEGSLFSGDGWGLHPIKTSVSKQGPLFDSVPSTPLYNSTTTPQADSLFRSSPFPFADSVPSTPMYNSSTTSPKRFTEGSEDPYSFDNSFSRFDSFNTKDSGPFGSRDTLSRFDSMRSTGDSSDFDQGPFGGSRESFTRFDSFRSTADSDYNFGLPARESLTRFDSMQGTRDSFDHGHGFPSFDDADPFGSSGPFRTSFDAQTPRRDSDGPFGTSFDAQTPRRDSDGPFRTSFDAQTPRKEFDGPFRTSFDSQTPRKDSSDSWKAF